jgi:hypothetical protein
MRGHSGDHPVIGPRYGALIKRLPEAWLGLLECEARIAVVYAEEGSHAPICLFGIGAMVRDDFLREMKTPPHFWSGPELTRRIMRGESPVLNCKELREVNSSAGLNLVCLENCFRREYEANGEVQRSMMSGFIQSTRGYLWKEVISAQSWSPEHLDFILKTGGYLWDTLAGGYTTDLRKDASEIVNEPHVLGITRDLELKRPASWGASWVGALFDYHPPMLGFNRSEQRLLVCALPGETDEQIAENLDISLSAVKKMWVAIYRRVEDGLPEMIADPRGSSIPASACWLIYANIPRNYAPSQGLLARSPR